MIAHSPRNRRTARLRFALSFMSGLRGARARVPVRVRIAAFAVGADPHRLAADAAPLQVARDAPAKFALGAEVLLAGDVHQTGDPAARLAILSLCHLPASLCVLRGCHPRPALPL